jgi:hypothetical protein
MKPKTLGLGQEHSSAEQQDQSNLSMEIQARQIESAEQYEGHRPDSLLTSPGVGSPSEEETRYSALLFLTRSCGFAVIDLVAKRAKVRLDC